MTILIATDIYFPTLGGISVATRQLAQGLAQNGHTVCIVAPGNSLRTHRKSEGKITTIYLPGISMLKEKGFRIVLNTKAIKSIIEDLRPDVIHVMTVGPESLGSVALRAGKRMGIPVVMAVHYVSKNITEPLRLPKLFAKQVESVTRKTIYTHAQLADAVVFPTMSAAKVFLETHPVSSVSAISNGIFTERYDQKDAHKVEEIKKRFNLSDKKVITYVGRLERDKKVDILLQAFSQINPQLNAVLLLIGKGPEAENLSDYAKELKINDLVRFAGFVEDDMLPAAYQASDIFVMPSDVELQSIATMEAMASGKPVIGANAIALPELIQDGENGYLFKPNDAVDLAKKLSAMLTSEEKRKEMGKEAKKRIQKHSMIHITGEFEALYDAVHKKSLQTDFFIKET